MRWSVLQDWIADLPIMQQTSLLSAVRGPDGIHKESKAKFLAKWLRRCLLLSAFDKKVFETPYAPGGGSFTGPSVKPEDCPNGDWEPAMDKVVNLYFDAIDELPLHYHLHILHAVEILGYNHPDQKIGGWWLKTYVRMAKDMHVNVETREQLYSRLNDNEELWRTDESRSRGKR